MLACLLVQVCVCAAITTMPGFLPALTLARLAWGVALGCGHYWPGEYIGVSEIIRGNGCRALSRCIENIARPVCVPCNSMLLRSLVRLQKPHF
jgi:hypothetical protein